jgi:hypothetical protein
MIREIIQCYADTDRNFHTHEQQAHFAPDRRLARDARRHPQ